jgi:hypothetical protein
MPAKHAPDSEPGKRVPRAGAHTATLCRHTPKVGAVCPNWARTDLCGGRSVMSVPTAISGIRERAMYLRYCDNSHWLRQNGPAETVRV